MRRTQTSEDRPNRPSLSGDGGGDNAPAPALHEDYDPEVEWRIEEPRHVIRLKVEGFEKEHLRVQANTIHKEVIVTGERPQDSGRPVRFRKTFQLDNDKYKMDAIRAKLRHGTLDIILPLKKPEPLSQSPAGEEPKATTDINRGPKADAVACGGSSLGLKLEKQRAWWVLAGVVMAIGAIGLGAFLIYIYFMI